MLELLEQRRLLSADLEFVFVNIQQDEAAFGIAVAEAAINADRSIEGQISTSNPLNEISDASLEGRLIDRSGGGVRLAFDDGAPGRLFEIGAGFGLDGGSPLGWRVAYDASIEPFGYSGLEFGAMIQRPEAASIGDLQGTWFATMVEIEAGGNEKGFLSGTLSVSGGGLSLSLANPSGERTVQVEAPIAQSDGRGRFDMAPASGDDFRVYLGHGGGVAVLVNLGQDGAASHVGVAVKQDISVSAADVVGAYRLAMLEASADSDQPPAATHVINLKADGGVEMDSARRVDMTDAFSGGGVGQWSLENGVVSLHMDGRTIELAVSAGGEALLPFGGAVGTDLAAAFGIGTRADAVLGGTPAEPVRSSVLVSDLDENGRPVVLDLRAGTNDEWITVDLIREAGAGPDPARVLEIENWTHPGTGQSGAVVVSVDGVFMFERSDGGEWSARNLTFELFDDGARPITGSVTIYNDLDDQLHVAGISDEGNLVIYSNGQGAGSEWSFHDISAADLLPNGLSTPDWVGDLVSYTTAWNGLNIAGLDADGNIQVAWWAPGLGHWVVNNLSEITGAPSIASGLTAYVTPWGGINLAGLDENGAVTVTWWAPDRGAGNWATDNLTEQIDGPRLTGENISSYVAPWGGLNIAGMDEQGEITVYWWAPDRGPGNWAATPLTAGLDPSQPRPVSLMSARAADVQFNLFGKSEEGELVRLWWQPGESEWSFQDLPAFN